MSVQYVLVHPVPCSASLLARWMTRSWKKRLSLSAGHIRSVVIPKTKVGCHKRVKHVESNLQAMRLSAALQQTTFAQMELGVRSDLTLLSEWSRKFHVFASQQAGFKRVSIQAVETHHCWQGGLDLQYLSNRYEKGKKAVAEFLDKQHSCSTYRNLTLAHGEIVSKQASLGPSAFLGWLKRCH